MLNALNAEGAGGELVERSSPRSFGGIDLRCSLRAARRYDGLPSECENDVDRTEVVENISARDNCNESG
jgi:hypothetical protein